VVKQEYIEKLVGAPGHRVVALHLRGEGRERELVVELERTDIRFRCPCGRQYMRYYDRSGRMVRDLSFGPFRRVWLLFYQFRVSCPACGVKTEQLDWVQSRVRYTKRLAAAVALSCGEIGTIKATAARFDLHWETVNAIEKKALAEGLPGVHITDGRRPALDEFSIRRRH